MTALTPCKHKRIMECKECWIEEIINLCKKKSAEWELYDLEMYLRKYLDNIK